MKAIRILFFVFCSMLLFTVVNVYPQDTRTDENSIENTETTGEPTVPTDDKPIESEENQNTSTEVETKIETRIEEEREEEDKRKEEEVNPTEENEEKTETEEDALKNKIDKEREKIKEDRENPDSPNYQK